MLSVPMEHTDMRRSFGSERSTSARHVTAPRVLMITSASLARSIFSSSVGRSVYTITSPNGASRSRWGEPWICIGSSPGTTMVNRPSKLIPFSASAPLRRKSPVGRLSPRPPESQGRRLPFDLAEHQCYHSLMQCDPIPRLPMRPHMLQTARSCSQNLSDSATLLRRRRPQPATKYDKHMRIRHLKGKRPDGTVQAIECYTFGTL